MCHVLVIEDEPLIADYIADLAEQGGATSIAFATSEADAIASARDCFPDLILSDVDLKAGGRGPLAVSAIQTTIGAVPVIFITGTPEDCEPCEDAAAILSKPIIAGLVVSEIQRVAPQA